MYKPRTAEVIVKNTGNVDFVDELQLKIPTKSFIKKLNIPLNQSVIVKFNYDEYNIITREYNVNAKIIYQGKVIDSKTVKILKKKPGGFLDFFVHRTRYPNTYKYYSGFTKTSMWYKYSIHGTGSYLYVHYHDITGFLEPGFNYELQIKVIEQASFFYNNSYSCVSYPNTYSKAFVNICGPQDEIWDYVYHDKSYPEVRIYIGNTLVYNTVMTGANKGTYGYYSKHPVTDTFKIILEQDQYEPEYYWFRIENFSRSTNAQKVLTNLDYRKQGGKIKLGGISGTDALGRKVNISNVIPIRIEAYTRVGRAADVSYSSWPYCKTEVYVSIARIY